MRARDSPGYCPVRILGKQGRGGPTSQTAGPKPLSLKDKETPGEPGAFFMVTKKPRQGMGAEPQKTPVRDRTPSTP